MRVGDAVEFFGDTVPVEEVAEQLNTIPYELFTRIGSRV
ncbi:alanine racemase C-terminal domain-containing protein, partial [Hydrogenophaga sp.]